MVDLEDREISRQCESVGARIEPGANDDDLPDAVGDSFYDEFVKESSAHGHPTDEPARDRRWCNGGGENVLCELVVEPRVDPGALGRPAGRNRQRGRPKHGQRWVRRHQMMLRATTPGLEATVQEPRVASDARAGNPGRSRSQEQ